MEQQQQQPETQPEVAPVETAAAAVVEQIDTAVAKPASKRKPAAPRKKAPAKGKKGSSETQAAAAEPTETVAVSGEGGDTQMAAVTSELLQPRAEEYQPVQIDTTAAVDDAEEDKESGEQPPLDKTKAIAKKVTSQELLERFQQNIERRRKFLQYIQQRNARGSAAGVNNKLTQWKRFKELQHDN